MNQFKKQNILSENLIQYYQESIDNIQFDGNSDGVFGSLHYVLSMKNTNVRPLLLLHANQLFDGQLEEAIPAAITVEMFHNFVLVHDDIMDNAPTRKEMSTVHVKYGLGTAINTGDLFMIMAYNYLTRINSEYFTEVVALYNETSTKILEGRSIELKFEEYDHVSVEDYLLMIEMKTSLLTAFSLKLGALLAGASPEDQSLMNELGRNIGLCLQLREDWHDVYGDSTEGKNFGGDIVANKKTILYLNARHNTQDEGRMRFPRNKAYGML